MEFLLDALQSVEVSIDNVVEAARFGISRLARVDCLVKLRRDVFAESLRVWALVGGKVGELAPCLGEFVDILCSLEVALVQATYEGEGADQVRGEVFGVIYEVGNGGLRIGVKGTIENDATVFIIIVCHNHGSRLKLGRQRRFEETVATNAS
jgi:hypothetical protein